MIKYKFFKGGKKVKENQLEETAQRLTELNKTNSTFLSTGHYIVRVPTPLYYSAQQNQ